MPRGSWANGMPRDTEPRGSPSPCAADATKSDENKRSWSKEPKGIGVGPAAAAVSSEGKAKKERRSKSSRAQGGGAAENGGNARERNDGGAKPARGGECDK
jgi:hypothetical protein